MGLEPTMSRLLGWCNNQLHHGTTVIVGIYYINININIRYLAKSQARIQEFSTEGVQISKYFDKQKKKKKKKWKKKIPEENIGDRVVAVLSLLQRYGLNPLSRQLFKYKFISIGHGLLYNCTSLSTQTHRGHGSFYIVNVSGRGFVGPPPEKFWLNWCKIV